MVDMSRAPVPKAGVRFEELDGEAVVYDRQGKRATYLNETAAVIWKLCDGSRSVHEIVGLLAQEYPEAAGTMEGDVREAVDRLIADRVMVLAKGPEVTH